MTVKTFMVGTMSYPDGALDMFLADMSHPEERMRKVHIKDNVTEDVAMMATINRVMQQVFKVNLCHGDRVVYYHPETDLVIREVDYEVPDNATS